MVQGHLVITKCVFHARTLSIVYLLAAELASPFATALLDGAAAISIVFVVLNGSQRHLLV